MTASLRRLVLLALLAGCSRPAPTPTPAATTSPGAQSPTQSASAVTTQGATRGALAPLASEALIVLPVQSLRVSVPEWTEKVGEPRAYLSTVDDEIAFAIRERGVKGQWAFPTDLARSAKRNPGYTADPYNVAVDALTPVERDAEKLIGEPLAGQLRAFAGLFNARYALIPVEMRLVPDPSGGRASLHLVVVDTRAARLTWKADVPGDGVRNFTPAVAAGIAGRVADLFITAR